MIVLGYHWLTHYNPSIDWVLGSITFWQMEQYESKSSPSIETHPLLAPSMEIPDPVLEPPNPILLVNPQKPLRVTLINTTTNTCTSKLEGSECFKLQISHPKVTGHLTTSETPVDMSSVPKDYHDFSNVFSKSKVAN